MNKKKTLLTAMIAIGGLFLLSSVFSAGIENTVVQFSAVSYDKSLALVKNRQFSNLGSVVNCVNNSNENTPCAHIYVNSSKSEFIIDLCQDLDDRKKGLYYLDAKGSVKYYAWFDNQFMSWACAEKASAGNATEIWGIRSEPGLYNALLFNFYINQSAGYYYIRLMPDGRVKVLDKQVEDLT